MKVYPHAPKVSQRSQLCLAEMLERNLPYIFKAKKQAIHTHNQKLVVMNSICYKIDPCMYWQIYRTRIA